ncbi:MAG: hypothetical protein R3C02_04775 [Planctomycetaceae bacterium]
MRWSSGAKLRAGRGSLLALRGFDGAALRDGTGHNVTELLELTDLDRRIWDEELADFVPAQVFDAHAHLPLERSY